MAYEVIGSIGQGFLFVNGIRREDDSIRFDYIAQYLEFSSIITADFTTRQRREIAYNHSLLTSPT